MTRERLTRIGRIFVEGTLVDRAVEAAARDALALHKQAGVPVVLYRDGKIVTVSARTLLSARSACTAAVPRHPGRREGCRRVKVAERSLEEAIECALLENGPDACAGDSVTVREALTPYGDERRAGRLPENAGRRTTAAGSA